MVSVATTLQPGVRFIWGVYNADARPDPRPIKPEFPRVRTKNVYASKPPGLRATAEDLFRNICGTFSYSLESVSQGFNSSKDLKLIHVQG